MSKPRGGMDLDVNWQWNKRKLTCRVLPETGNPAGDDLRARFAELANVDLRELLSQMKTSKKKIEEAHNGIVIDHEGDKKFREVLNRSHILGATSLSLQAIEKKEEAKAASLTAMNIKKRFARLPSSPPKRVLLEIQRERSKPLRLPDQDEALATAAKLQKKMEKERKRRQAARDREAALEEALRNTAQVNTLDLAEVKDRLKGSFSAYNGDLYSSKGPYLESMLYLSRMKDTLEKSKRIGDRNLAKPSDDETKQAVAVAKKEEEVVDVDADDQAAFHEGSQTTDLGSKIYCAAALCNWARNPANASRLAAEGAVRAIMQLSLESNPQISRFCAGAFRFMSEHYALALSMIEDGAISTISDVIKGDIDSPWIATNLAIALVNLTRINGKEALVVECMIVLALTNLTMRHPEVAPLCARGLYNLTCVDASYPLLERVIKALITLSATGAGTSKHICAAALCNLADLKTARARLIEEGAISVLGTLARGAVTRTRRVCAVILQNLSASKSVRIEMVTRSSVSVAYGLSSDQDPIILRCIGLTLARLSAEPANCLRIIQEFGVNALCNIATKFPTIPGISQPVATAFQFLSSRPAVRVAIVQEGCVTALAALLHLSVDLFTLQNSLFALCNLLSEPDNHLPIVQQGLILTLVNLSNQDTDVLKDLCALAFLNLSCAEESHKHIVNAGAIAAVITLANQSNPLTRRRCAAALCNVSAYEMGMSKMVQDGIIPALVKLINDDLLTIHCSCAALCRLCSSMENGLLILESGAVPSLVNSAIEGDALTKQFCGAVLSTLSFYESCRITLCEFGIISALKSLAQLSDPVTKQRCLVAYANISCEAGVQEKMVDEGVVAIIADLANSYEEINYICCAKAMCNLACSASSKYKVATQGGVHALLMISMVHSVDKETKLLCVLALANLLDESTIDFMLQEGLATSVANLSKLDDIRVSNLCVKLFNQISSYPAGMSKLVERNSVLTALFSMLDSPSKETQIICSRTAANLVCDRNVRQKAIDGKALSTIEKGISLDDEAAALQCIKAVFSVCDDESFLVMIARSTMPVSLVKVVRGSSGEKFDYAMKALSLVAYNKASRAYLQSLEFSLALIDLVAKTFVPKESARWVALTIRFICIGNTNSLELVQNGLANALWRLHEHGAEPGLELISQSAAEALRCICSEPGCSELLANSDIVQILCRAAVQNRGHFVTSYNVCVALFRLAVTSAGTQAGTATPDAVTALSMCSEVIDCYELIAASLCLYLLDSKTRYTFANDAVALIVSKILTSSVPEDAIYNAVSASYALSKLPIMRDVIVKDPVNLDSHLLKISQSGGDKMKSNCSRALKNMTSDTEGAIEEGAVAALIAMSLEGKAKNNKVGDELRDPVLQPVKPSEAPPCSKEVLDQCYWYAPKVTTIGGPAGVGPAAPAPPHMSADADSEAPFAADELDGADVEGRAKMSFAKMGIPNEQRDACMLKDEDFDVKDDSSVEDCDFMPGGDFERSDVIAGGAVGEEEGKDGTEVNRSRTNSAADDRFKNAKSSSSSPVSSPKISRSKKLSPTASPAASPVVGNRKRAGSAHTPGAGGASAVAAAGGGGSGSGEKEVAPRSSINKGKKGDKGGQGIDAAVTAPASIGNRVAQLGLYQ